MVRRAAHVITWIAAAIGIVTAVGIPALFWTTAYHYELIHSRDDSKHLAGQVSSFIYANPDTWRFQLYRLEEKLTRNEGALERGHLFRLVDAAGTIVFELGQQPPAPTMSVATAVSDGFEIVGRLEFIKSTRTLWIGTGFSALAGILVGAIVFLTLRVLPLRALARALGDLEAEIARRRRIEEELRANQEQLRHMANYDALTGIPNRSLGKDRLAGALARAHRDGTKVALLFVDLDGFKAINDDFGHHAGDGVLKEMSQRLVGCVRETDTVSRFGGDEFTVIITDVRDKDVLEAVAEKVLQDIARPFKVGGEERRLGASIGIAFYPDDSETLDELIRIADGAMYKVKVTGKGGYQLVTDDRSAA